MDALGKEINRFGWVWEGGSRLFKKVMGLGRGGSRVGWVWEGGSRLF